MADLILTEATVAERGGTTTSYGTRCCTKARAIVLNCTVTSPSGATDTLLITGIKGNRSGAVSCANVTYGSTVTATVSGNTESGTVTWSVTNGTGSATISTAGKVTPTKAGTVTINASVAATTNYNAYTATSKLITISKASRSGAVSCSNVTYGSTVTATVSGNTESGTVTWGITAGTGTATISSAGKVTPTKVGTVTVTASVAATTNYSAYTATSKLITISKKSTAAPVLTAGGTTTYTGDAYYAKAANASGNPAGKIYYGASSGATTYNVTASTTAANLTSMGRVNVGTTTIYAFFRPTDTTNYADSSSASTTVKITNKAALGTLPTPTGWTGSYDGNWHSATFPEMGGASITKWRYSSDNSTWTEYSENPATQHAGTMYSQAYYSPDSNHTGGGWSSSATVKVNKAAASITFGTPTTTVKKGSTVTNKATIKKGTGTITYSSSNTSVATVNSSGKVTGVSVGSSTITATLPASDDYKKATATYTISVTGSTIKINNTSSTYAFNCAYKAYYDNAYHEEGTWGANAGSYVSITLNTVGSWTLYLSNALTILQSSGTVHSASITSSITDSGTKTFSASISQSSITVSST